MELLLVSDDTPKSCWSECVRHHRSPAERLTLSANPCQRWLPVWHHHILLITVFSSSSSSFPRPQTWQQMRHPWRLMTRQQPRSAYSELLSICSLGGKKQNRWDPMNKKKKVSVSDNCLGQQSRVGLKVSARAIGVIFRVMVLVIAHADNVQFDRKLPWFHFRQRARKNALWIEDVTGSGFSFVTVHFSVLPAGFECLNIRGQWRPPAGVKKHFHFPVMSFEVGLETRGRELELRVEDAVGKTAVMQSYSSALSASAAILRRL